MTNDNIACTKVNYIRATSLGVSLDDSLSFTYVAAEKNKS